MKLEKIKILCCPFDKADLALTTITSNDNGDVIEGFFICEDCKRVYPIIKGVPIMNPDEYREFALEKPLFEKWEKYLGGIIPSTFKISDKNKAIEEGQ